ncbi:MAG: hypothetical protein U1F24_06980 [Alphaproteobacteria bacterium]
MTPPLVSPPSAAISTTTRAIAAASLKRLSPSTIVESRRGAPMSRKMLSTAAVSVGATIAPTRNASSSNSCHSADSTVTPSAVMKGKRLAPTTAQHSTTAKMAITRIGQISSIVRRMSTCSPAANSSGGRKR